MHFPVHALQYPGVADPDVTRKADVWRRPAPRFTKHVRDTLASPSWAAMLRDWPTGEDLEGEPLPRDLHRIYIVLKRLREGIRIPIDSLRAPLTYKISRRRQQDELYKIQARQVSLAQKGILHNFYSRRIHISIFSAW